MKTDLLIPQDATWKPRHHTSPLKLATVMEGGIEKPVYNTRTMSAPIKAFAEYYLKPQKGFKSKEPLRFTSWQSWLLDNVLEMNQYGYLRYQTAVIMLPRKNGKTFLGAILVLSHLLSAPDSSEIYSAAVDRTQARLVFDLVKFWIEETPILRDILQVKDSKNTIVNTLTKSTYRALAADAASTQGLQPYVVIADEVHYWESQNGSKRAKAFWDALTKGSASLPECQFIVITTAGENKNDSLLGSLYKRGEDAVANPDSEDDSFGFFCWEADESDPPWEVDTWKKANPNIAEGLINLTVLNNALQEAKKMGFSGFLRYHLNIWSSIAGDPFMSPHHWKNAISETQTDIKPGSKVTAGFDASWNRDATSIVVMDYETGFFKIWRVWERPDDADEQWLIPRHEVIQAVHDLFKTYDVEVMYADRKFYADEIHEWRVINKYKVQEYAQDATTISGSAARFLTNIVDKTITHDGGEVLTRHVLNAIADPAKAYKKKTRDSREKIDSLAAAVMSNQGRDFFKLREQPKKQDNKPTPSFFGGRRR